MIPLEKPNLDVEFYRSVIDKMPAIAYINEFKHRGDVRSLRNLWSNGYAQQLMGYTQHEIDELGFAFFEQSLHPDDFEIIKNTAQSSSQATPNSVFTIMYRMKPKGETEYKWLYGNGIIFEQYDDGCPKKLLGIVVEITQIMHTENQLVTALREINKLKNELRSTSLSKREKEVLSLIPKGLTDREISRRLSISPETAKTHRNKMIKKLGLKNSASLAAFATECGL